MKVDDEDLTARGRNLVVMLVVICDSVFPLSMPWTCFYVAIGPCTVYYARVHCYCKLFTSISNIYLSILCTEGCCVEVVVA